MISNISVKGVRLFPKRDLPNSHGFKFLGYTFEGQKFRCEVVKGSDGCHRIEGMAFSDLFGWTNERNK